MWDRRYILGAGIASLLTATDALAAKKKKASAKSTKGKKGKSKPKKPAPPPPPPVTSPENRAALNGVFDAIYKDALRASPMLLTALGLDKGEYEAHNSRLDDRSIASKAAISGRLRRARDSLKALDRGKLHEMDRINYDAVLWDISTALEGAEAFSYGEAGSGTPYVLSQLSGLYQSVPDFLDNQHTIESKADAESYVARLNAYAVAIGQETERARDDFSKGVIPPDFVISTALKQLEMAYGGAAADNVMVQSIVRRAAAANLVDGWGQKAQSVVEGAIFPALQKQAETLKNILPKASHLAGIMHRPQGEAYYAWAARYSTTTKMTPREIHELGLVKVAELSSEIDARFRALGHTTGTAGERMRALNTDPKQIYPNTPEGKKQLLGDLNKKVDTIFAKLPQYFKTLPKSKVDIRAVPEAIEAGAPGGYYQGPSLDGTRPGAYYINLQDTAQQPSWLLPTLTYHEAVPGHHMQIAIQQEAEGLPDLRKISGFNAYIEGWALYAEQVALEMGMYENDPYGRIGYLHDALFRACRLVVDTGMHYLGWSREQAVRFMMEKMGDGEVEVTREIDRYCVWPGQALGYMVGKIQWLKLRDASKRRLGAKFDIRTFHDTGLLCAAVPLDVLETVYKEAGQV